MWMGIIFIRIKDVWFFVNMKTGKKPQNTFVVNGRKILKKNLSTLKRVTQHIFIKFYIV